MKKVLLSLVAMMVATTSFAQNTVVASLSHEGETTMFYGVGALQKAVNAAVSGDIISLSNGTFNATNITKAITLRGVGIDNDNPTYIDGVFSINVSEEGTNRFTMEGIRCKSEVKLGGKFSSPYFVKCQFYRINGVANTDAIENVMIVNCKVTDFFRQGGNTTVSLVNSYIAEPGIYESAHFMATNCIISKYDLRELQNSIWKNCILWTTNSYNYRLPISSKAYNCLSIPFDLFTNLTDSPNNTSMASLPEVFTDFNWEGTWSDAWTFTLTDAGKAVKGTDGKEVGLYGGPMPFNLTLSYPLISKMEVEEQTDDNGQLKVEIGVK
ncbi:MAG: hypothetical protein IK075_02475 [Prevotella sp.]|nr:hypothetical protein [Prevotella sp.]